MVCWAVFALWARMIGDAVKESLPALLQELLVAFSNDPVLAFSGLVGESSRHSKPSVAWKNEDPFTFWILPRTVGVFEFFLGV